MTPKVKPTVEGWEEISKKLRLCPECWTLSEGAGYCDCGGFKRLDFNDLPEEEKRAWVDGFERGESHSVQEAKAEGYQECLTELCKKAKRVGLTSELIDIIFPKASSLKQDQLP